MCAVLAVAAAAPVWGQTWRFVPSVTLRETGTNNVNLEPTDIRISDFVTEITPAFTVSERGDRTRIDGSVSVPILLYARTGNENNYIAPAVNLLGDVSLFNRILHVEGYLSVAQQFFTPFGAQPPDLANATDNRYRTTTYRISPYVQGIATNGIVYELRNNNEWVQLNGAPITTSNSRATEWFARVSTPENSRIGLEANYDYNNITFESQDLGSLRTQIGRLMPFYNVDPQLRLGASVGYEDNQGTFTSSRGAVYGVGFEWRPTDRTKVVGKWEHRYFGSSYLFTFDHRTRLSVWNVQASRNVTTFTQQLGGLGTGRNVSDQLNQLYLSSIPDESVRQQAIDQLIRDRGLPPTLTEPVTLYADQLVLEEKQSATVGLIGARNSIFFTVFNVRSEPISAAGNPLPPTIFSFNANTQTGGNIVWTNSLTPTINLIATLNAYRTVATAPLTGYTNQGIAAITLSTPISPRMSGFMGARYQALTSDVISGYNETALFVGLSYALR